MDRRAYLATGALVAGTTAGCTLFRERKQLRADAPDDSGVRVVLPFTSNGEDVLRVELVKQDAPREEPVYYPFIITMWRRDDVWLDDLRFSFRSPPDADGISPAGIALRDAGRQHAATFRQTRADPSTTVLDIPNTTDIEGDSLTFQLLLASDPRQSPQELWVRVEAELSSREFVGPLFEAQGEMTVEFP